MYGENLRSFEKILIFGRRFSPKKKVIIILISFKCNLLYVSEYVVRASGHSSSIQDHESPMIIQGEYKVHLLNDKIRRNACLSCLLLICENLFYIFPYTCFLLSLWVAVNSVTISSSHDRDSRSPIFFQNLCIYSSQSRDSRTFIFNTWCFNELEFICKTHVCKQINVLLGPTSFISELCSREEKIYLYTCKYTSKLIFLYYCMIRKLSYILDVVSCKKKK